MKQFNQLILSGIFMCIALTSLGQKDAPVVGNAAELVDLLNKDYYTISAESRDQEFSQDRKQVINVFKSYLTDQQKKAFEDAIKNDKSSLVANKDVSYKKYQDAKYAYDAELKAKVPTATNLLSLDKAAKAAFSGYSEDQMKLDTSHIGKLQRIYGKDKNTYLEFLASLFKDKYDGILNKKVDLYADIAMKENVQKGLPFLGGDLSFTTAIDGLSRFLAKRIKEELTTYVIDHVKDWLKNPKEGSPLVEFKVLLPKTVDYLMQFEADQMLNFPDEIKQYIEDDLNDILPNIGNLKDTPRMQRLLEMYPEMDFAFEALELIPRIAKIKHPLEYFEVLENSRNIDRWRESGHKARHNVANAIMFTTLLARSFTTSESGQLELADLEDVDLYLDDTRFFLAYFGFLHQQNIKYYEVNFLVDSKDKLPLRKLNEQGKQEAASNVNRYNFPLVSVMHQTMQDFNSDSLAKLGEARDNFENLLSEFGLQVDQVNATALQIRKLNKKGEKVPVELASEFIGNVIDLTESFTIGADSIVNYLLGGVEKLNFGLDSAIIDERPGNIKYQIKFGKKGLDLERLALERSAKPYLKAARISNEIIIDLHEKKFANAILKALEIASELLPENDFTEIIELIENIEELHGTLDQNDLGLMMEVLEKKDRQLKTVKNTKSHKEKWTRNELRIEARKLKTALDNVATYYKQVNPGVTFPAGVKTKIDAVNKELTLLSNYQDSITNIKHTDLRIKLETLSQSEDFRRMLISYYSDGAIDTKFSSKIAEKLMQISFTNKHGEEIRPFDSADSVEFVALLDDLVDLSITWVLSPSGKKKEIEQKMADQKQYLVQFLANYSLTLPVKFKVNPNSQLFKLVHFVNDVAASENSEDVEKAIEAFALPSGSFAIKRTAKFNASINSYPGILLGSQLTRRDYDPSKWVGKPTSSLSVPVGLSMSWGSRNAGSIGLYVPIIDIGAITRLHLDDDTSTLVLPDINFKNIVSPGLYVVYGIPRSPLSITHGFQFGPELRKIDAEGNTERFESWRVGIGLTLDIPLLNLYTRPRFN